MCSVDLKTGHVRILNGQPCPDFNGVWILNVVRFLNGSDHSKTELSESIDHFIYTKNHVY